MAEESKKVTETEGESVAIAAAQRMNAIKELLFGENLEEFEHKFSDLFTKLEDYHNEFENRIRQITKKHDAEIARLTKQFEEQIAQMDNEFNSKVNQVNNTKITRDELYKVLTTVAEELRK